MSIFKIRLKDLKLKTDSVEIMALVTGYLLNKRETRSQAQDLLKQCGDILEKIKNETPVKTSGYSIWTAKKTEKEIEDMIKTQAERTLPVGVPMAEKKPLALPKRKKGKRKFGKHYAWKEEEDKHIKEALEAGKKMCKITKEMQKISPWRTANSIRRRIWDIEHNVKTVAKKSKKLGRPKKVGKLRKRRYNKRPVWTPEEDTLILANMKMRPKDLLKHLPGHDLQAVYDRRWRLKKGLIKR